MKVLDFLQSRTFVTHVTGLITILFAGVAIPNSTTASVAIAALTGITQAAHAYQAVKTQQTITSSDVNTAIGTPNGGI